jgi:beta-lactamase class A
LNTGKRFVAFASALLAVLPMPAAAADDLQQAFDSVFRATQALPPTVQPQSILPDGTPAQPLPVQPRTLLPRYASPLDAQLAGLAEASRGRIGVAAIDLASGRSVAVLGDQPFPLASTIKVAIVATFLQGVDEGRFSLTDSYPLMIPVPSKRFASAVAPVRQGAMLSAQTLIELALTRSDNRATDALLAALGGPQAVDRWLRRAGITGIRLDHDIATMVRDDGAINPVTTVDVHDSTTPLAMVQLLAGLYQGQWLSPASRDVLLGAMSRCLTGIHRMRAGLPEEALIGHKTGSLSNTSSDVGFIRTPDGRTVALAIYVTGQGGRPGREQRIASIAHAVYAGYQPDVQMAARTVSR